MGRHCAAQDGLTHHGDDIQLSADARMSHREGRHLFGSARLRPARAGVRETRSLVGPMRLHQGPLASPQDVPSGHHSDGFLGVWPTARAVDN